MSRQILIVNDNATNRKELRNILNDEHEILESENGTQALEILKLHPNDIEAVVLDIAVPTMDGCELLKVLREDVLLSHIPVIVSVGSESGDAELKALELGAMDFIRKPFNVQIIRQRVRNIILFANQAKDLDALRISEERFRIAASAGGRITARWDIKTGVYYKSDEALTKVDFRTAVENVPQAFIDRDMIAPESVAEYKDFFMQMRTGRKTCTATLSIRMNEANFRWFCCDATVIYDAAQQPSQAIIVYTDITEQREKESVYRKWQQSLQQKRPEDYTLFHCNLTKDCSYETVDGNLIMDHFQNSTITFNEQTRDYTDDFVYHDDRDRFSALVDSDVLLANYYRNKRTQMLEYREILPNADVRWIRLTIELVEYPNSTDIGAYLMFEDINEQKLEEIRVKELAEHDPLTGVLNRVAFAEQMDEIIKTSRNKEHAFMMLDIDQFKSLNDNYGHAAGDQALINLADNLRATLRHGDLLGRLGGDEFILFLKDIPYNAVIEKKAGQICAFTRKTYDLNTQISASIGIAVYPRDGETFEMLYRHADDALYKAKRGGKDRFCFYDDEINKDAESSVENGKLTQSVRSDKRKTGSVHRILIADDSKISRRLLCDMFQDRFQVETANDGASALARLKHFGAGIAVVLLDLMMPGMDGFDVLEQMRLSPELRSIPVIVVSAKEDKETLLRAVRAGAADYIAKPVDPELLLVRVEAAISRAESERLRAQNSYLLLQNSEEAKYRTVLDATGISVIEFDWINGVFIYDTEIATRIAGNYDNRRLWQILLSDMVADTKDVKAMQELVHGIANDRGKSDGSLMVKLKTPSGRREWFSMRVFKRTNEYQLTNKMIITLNNVNEEILVSEQLHFQAEHDELTGLLNRKSFFEQAEKLISSHKPGRYVMTSFDIDSFKVINDQYGSEKGDDILKQVAEIFREGFSGVGGLISRITADNYAVLYPASFIGSSKLRKIHDEISRLDGSIPPISFSIGRYIIEDLTLSVSGMYDRATLAQSSVKGRYDTHVAQYDETMRHQLIKRQRLIGEMKSALESGQFEVWFQPQYNHSTGARIGAEALVRWRHPERGIVQPNEFIPAFERSGFIYELDKYVWEQTCSYLRKWMDEGHDPLPVSVNISRYDILREDLSKTLLQLMAKYMLPVELLRLEVTESAFSKDTVRIVSVVKQLIAHGFTVEIDDFGSGYSSLNTLKDVPAQVLKMDMRFLETNVCSIDQSCEESSSRGGNILESVVRMAKWLGMAVIAEGVETGEQADYLKSIGCNYVQGYLYARPMPAVEYESLAKTQSKEERLLSLETVENYDNNRFWDPASMDTLIFNTYVGGACIFEWSDDRIELLRANDKFAQTLGKNRTVADVLRIDWMAHMDEATVAATKDAIGCTIASGDDAVFEASYDDLFGDGKKTYLKTTLRVIARTNDRYLIYATNENLTHQHELEQQRLDISRRLQATNDDLEQMMDDMPGGFARLRVLPGGLLTTDYVNESFCRLRGMTRGEILESDSANALSTVHPDDVENVHAAIAKILETGATCRMQYRLRCADGNYLPLTVFGRGSLSESGEPFINAYYAEMNEEEKRVLAISSVLPVVLSTIMSSTTDLSFVKDMDFRYLSCSKPFAGMVGKDDETGVVGKTDFELFNRETAERYRQDDMRLLESGEALIDYLEAIPSDDGIQHYSNTSKYILRDGTGEMVGLYGVGRDVTEVSTAFDRLKLLADSIPGGLATYAMYPEGLRIIYFNDGLCKLFGCTREEYAAASKDNVITTVFKEDIPRLQAQVQRMIADRTPVDCTYRISTMNGSGNKWINLRATPAEKRGGILQAHAVLYDVTEQKMAEEAARVHEEEMRYAISLLGKMICEYDPVSKVLTVPESYAMQYGTASRIENVPDSIIDSGIISEETLLEYRNFYEAILRGDKTGSTEFCEKRQDGKLYWEHLEFSSIFNSEGNPIKTVISAEDTTRQHQDYELEQARPTLGEDNLLVHAMFNLTTGETLDYAYQDGSEVPTCERTAFLFGGDNLDEIIADPDERERYRELNDPSVLLRHYESGETEFTIDYRRKLRGGEIIWARNILRMVRRPGGSDILLFEYCYNIEKEKTWEQIYAILTRDNYDYVARVNGANGRFELLAIREDSQGLPPMRGDDLDTAAKPWIEEFVHPDDKAALVEFLAIEGVRARLAENDSYQISFRMLIPDGELRYKKLNICYLDRARDIIISAQEDVSKPVQEEMRKNAQLSDALDAANQASRAKSQFLSRMSHELRTPMNAIIGLAALSASEVNDPKAMEDSIGKIGMSARYLLSLINDILEMSRIESGKMSLNEAPFDFERLISEVNNVIYTQAEEKGLDYDAVVTGYTEASYVGDSVKLQQILINILGNAVKFTPRGGKVTLGIEQLRRTKKGVALKFTVTDTGIGIDEKFLPHLFDMFEQESESFTATSTGTGLGLPIAKNLVEMMNGRISVKSIKGVGSVFTVLVQLGITKESERYLDMAASMKLDHLRALVVDDDIMVCRSTQDILKKLGMQAEWADSGPKAIEYVRKAKEAHMDFDTVIIDWKMPDMDGIETTRHIRALVGPDVTIIIMTAYDWRSIEAEAREAGVNLFMEKPLFQSSVVKAFEQVFLKHRPKDEPDDVVLPDFTGRRILLAEDNPLNAEVARRMLETVGAQVVTVCNGLEVIETFTTQPNGCFDAILMDIRMPVMDGLTATKSIRRLKKEGSKTIPIIAMTANAFDEDMELSLASGMNAHLTKPVEPQLLFATLKRLFARQ